MQPGTIVDARYELLRSLGEGGMGTVFLARELGLERFVAVKFLKAGLLSDPDSSARFERESKILAAVEHENIVSLYRFGIWQQQYPYLVMEYLEGMSLRARISEGSLSTSDSIVIAAQLCSALQKVHDLGITHRDLKPDNIMVLPGAPLQAKVLDFGLSNFADSKAQHLTQTGALIGSVHYMSPEQCLGRRADNRSDIYSLGCILYELLAGNPPFACDNPIGLIHKHTQQQAEPFSPALKVPAGLEVIVFKALQKDPTQRHQSMAEFGSDLRMILEGQGQAFGALPGNARNKRARNSNVLVGAIAVAMIAMVTLTLMKMRNAEPSAVGYTTQRNSLKAKGLKSQYSLHQSSPDKRSASILALIKQFELQDDRSLSPWEIASMYDKLRCFGSCTSKQMTAHFDRLLQTERVRENSGAYAFSFLVRGHYMTAIAKYAEAESNFKTSLAISKQASDRDRMTEAAMALAHLYLIRNEPTKAKRAALVARNTCLAENPQQETATLVVLAETLSAMGEFAAARKATRDLCKNLNDETYQDSLVLDLCSKFREYSAQFALEQVDFFIESFKNRPKKDLLVPNLMLLKASLMLTSGNPSGSATCLDNLLARLTFLTNPEVTNLKSACLKERANCFILMGRNKQARADLHIAVSLSEPNSASRLDCLFGLAKIAAMEHKTAELNDYLHTADELNIPPPMTEEAIFRRYLSLTDFMAAGKLWTAAGTVMQHFTKRTSPHNVLWNDAARIMAAVYVSRSTNCDFNELEKARPAIEHLDKAGGTLDSEIQELLYTHYASALASAGKRRDAVQVYEIALKHLSADLARTNTLRLKLGCLHHELKNFDAAVFYLAELVRTAGEGLLKLQATQQLGNALVDAGRPDEALKVFAMVRVPDKTHAEAEGISFLTSYYQLTVGQARAYRAKNDLAKYRFYLGKALPMARFLQLKAPEV